MLPAALRSLYVGQRGLTAAQARLLASSPATASFFDQVVAIGAEPPAAANWITQDLAGLLNAAKLEIADSKITPQHMADLVALVADDTISATGAKQVLEEAFETGDAAGALVAHRGPAPAVGRA